MDMKIATGIWLSLAALTHAGGLTFKEALKDIKAPADVSEVTADFEFTNETDKPVTIAKADPTCSCLKVQVSGGKLKYAPGESGKIRLTFEMGNFSGTVDKLAALWLNNDPADKPSQSLTVRVHIPVLIGVEPKTLNWEVGAKPEPKTIQIQMAEGQNIKVLDVKNGSPAFSHELKTVEEGKKYELVVTPLSVDAAAMGIFRIETDCKLQKHKTQQAFAVVRKPTAAQASAKQ